MNKPHKLQFVMVYTPVWHAWVGNKMYINIFHGRGCFQVLTWCLDCIVWCKVCRSTWVNSVSWLQKHALLNRVESVTSEEERLELRTVSNKQHLAATLLPIRSVGVQVNSASCCVHWVLMYTKLIAVLWLTVCAGWRVLWFGICRHPHF